MSNIEGTVYNSDVKFSESVTGYVGLIFSNLNRMVQTLTNPELGTISTNIFLIGQLMISHIPDPEVRIKLRNKLNERIEELRFEKTNGDKLSDETKRYINVLAVTEIIGDVMDEVDLACGIVKESRISVDKECKNCMYAGGKNGNAQKP